MKTKQEVLRQCVVNGMVVTLPAVQLDRKLYMEVAQALELIGGKWTRKVQGFVFSHDPTELLSQIADGEKRNLKKEFQFFATPGLVADQLVALAGVEIGDKVLEPSAGQGALIEAINIWQPLCDIECCELMPTNAHILRTKGYYVIRNDFFEITDRKGYYDKVIANPPFSKNQDIDHVRKMYEVCKGGGRIVTVASTHWQQSENRKETQFRQWLEAIGATVIPLDKGAFKESGTLIAACIVVINKVNV